VYSADAHLGRTDERNEAGKRWIADEAQPTILLEGAVEQRLIGRVGGDLGEIVVKPEEMGENRDGIGRRLPLDSVIDLPDTNDSLLVADAVERRDDRFVPRLPAVGVVGGVHLSVEAAP